MCPHEAAGLKASLEEADYVDLLRRRDSEGSERHCVRVSGAVYEKPIIEKTELT